MDGGCRVGAFPAERQHTGASHSHHSGCAEALRYGAAAGGRTQRPRAGRRGAGVLAAHQHHRAHPSGRQQGRAARPRRQIRLTTACHLAFQIATATYDGDASGAAFMHMLLAMLSTSVDAC